MHDLDDRPTTEEDEAEATIVAFAHAVGLGLLAALAAATVLGLAHLVATFGGIR